MLPVGLLYIIRTYKVHRKRNNINIMGYVRFFSLLSSAHAFTSIISQANFNKNKTFLVQVWLVYNVLWVVILLAYLRVHYGAQDGLHVCRLI